MRHDALTLPEPAQAAKGTRMNNAALQSSSVRRMATVRLYHSLAVRVHRIPHPFPHKFDTDSTLPTLQRVWQYHKSGKHCVEYRRSGEKRWVNMLKTAFYIVERAQPSGGEVKEMEPDPTEGLAPVEVCIVCVCERVCVLLFLSPPALTGC